MDWSNVLITLIGSGGLVGLFLITERKTAAALKNMQTMYDILKKQYEDSIARNNEKDKKIEDLYNQIGVLHNEKDEANTRAAKSEMKRCDRINCGKRVPPLADQWRVDKDMEITGIVEE